MMNPGTVVKAILRSKGIPDGSKYQFRKDCVVFFIHLMLRLQERSPFKYSIVRSSSSLSPVNMVQNQQRATTQFSSLVEKLHQFDHVLPSIAVSAKEEFEKFSMHLPRITSSSLTFSSQELMKSWKLISKIKELYGPFVSLSSNSHIASVQSSGDLEILIENLQEKSIVC